MSIVYIPCARNLLMWISMAPDSRSFLLFKYYNFLYLSTDMSRTSLINKGEQKTIRPL